MIQTLPPLSSLNAMNKDTLMEALDIKYIDIGHDFVQAKMPVNKKTRQPMGLLHGGASAALIESIGSIGSALCIDLDQQAIVGLEINANHLKSVRNGFVYGMGKLIHCGKTTHLWQVDIKNEDNDLVCTGRLTVMIISKK